MDHPASQSRVLTDNGSCYRLEFDPDAEKRSALVVLEV